MKAIVIGGPTSAGKTSIALALAQALNAVVVSADAMQIYRGMDIGTGKATAAERADVLHFGIDIREVDQPFDVGDFLDLADGVITEHERVIVVGGTSMYLRALRRGLVRTPPPDEALREQIIAEGNLHQRLQACDPVLAERLHENDHIRLIRGIEVFLATGERLSELQAHHKQQPDRVDVRGIWLDRDDLDERINRRVLQMMKQGYLHEVEQLLRRFDRSHKPMRSLGYRHLADHLCDGLALDEAIRRTQRDSRRFARKQRTWGRHLGLTQGDKDTVFRLARALWNGV